MGAPAGNREHIVWSVGEDFPRIVCTHAHRSALATLPNQEDPLDFVLDNEPRLSSPLLLPVLTKPIFCSVLFLQKGQNLVVFFGSFIPYENQGFPNRSPFLN